MKSDGKAKVILLAVLLFAVGLNLLALGQQVGSKPKVDIGAFTTEVMKMRMVGVGGQLDMAFWVPYDFFVEAGLADGKLTREQMASGCAFLKNYVPMIIVRSMDKPDGSTDYASVEQLRAAAVLRLADGTEVRALEKVPPMVSATVGAMKAVMDSEGGVAGGMEVLVYPARDGKGRLIVDTAKRDKLTLVLKAHGKRKETLFTWHTPFDVKNPALPCGKCGEQMSIKWSYCPWCGTKLAEGDAKAQAAGPGRGDPEH